MLIPSWELPSFFLTIYVATEENYYLKKKNHQKYNLVHRFEKGSSGSPNIGFSLEWVGNLILPIEREAARISHKNDIKGK